MRASDFSDRIVIMVIGLLVVLAPVMIIVLTLSFLAITGDLVLGRVTLIEFLELYIIDLTLFTAFAYGLYRLTQVLVIHQLPASLDALEENEVEENAHEELHDDRK